MGWNVRYGLCGQTADWSKACSNSAAILRERWQIKRRKGACNTDRSLVHLTFAVLCMSDNHEICFRVKLLLKVDMICLGDGRKREFVPGSGAGYRHIYPISQCKVRPCVLRAGLPRSLPPPAFSTSLSLTRIPSSRHPTSFPQPARTSLQRP